ncbi:MAG: SDR family oxidoreductase [Planctomycetota bacterium]
MTVDPRSAIVTGGSSGLGFQIADALLDRDYSVTIVGRNRERLDAALHRLHKAREGSSINRLHAHQADVCDAAQVNQLVADHLNRNDALDVLVNVVGVSDRGRLDRLASTRIEEHFRQNVLSALLCSQACLPALSQRSGTIVNIGSLASRLAGPYLGAYVPAKHALAGLTRQLRLECEEQDVHVGLVCPGPIEHADFGENRYQVTEQDGIPASAALPGGGARVRRLPPQRVANAVMQCIAKRKVEIVLPAKARLLMILDAISPALADRILKNRMGG